jgi:hypothetical protein
VSRPFARTSVAPTGIVLIGLTVMLTVGCARGRLVQRGQVNDALVKDVQARLTAVRGLPFRRPVPARVLDEQALSQLLAEEIGRSAGPTDREHLDTAFAQLGLVAPGTRLEPAMQRLFTRQLAAFYDPRRGELGIAGGTLGASRGMMATVTGRDVVGEITIAHELTHALQDQYWGLPVDPVPVLDSHTDRVLARRALLEGDATWAAFATLAGGRLDEATRARVLEQLDALPGELARSVPDVPPLLRETLAFQYRDGSVFVDQLLLRGDWAAVNRAHDDPPESSEQVLHPERYLSANRDRPTPVVIGGTTALTRAGFAPVVGDTLGEIIIRTRLAQSLPAERAAAAADGWDGDRVMAFARGGESVVVWMTVWDSAADAAEFAGAMTAAEPGAHVERRGARVLVLSGPWPAALPAELWTAPARRR